MLEEPLDVAPLPAQLTLLPHLARLDSARIVQLHVDHLRFVAGHRGSGAVGLQARRLKGGAKGKVIIVVLLLLATIAGEAQEGLSQETTLTGAPWQTFRRVGGDMRPGRLLAVKHLVAEQTDVSTVGQTLDTLFVLAKLSNNVISISYWSIFSKTEL